MLHKLSQGMRRSTWRRLALAAVSPLWAISAQAAPAYTIVPLDNSYYFDTYVSGINKLGQVVGGGIGDRTISSLVWTNGVLGWGGGSGRYNWGSALNDHGEGVGYSFYSGVPNDYAVYWNSSGTRSLVALEHADGGTSHANSINNASQIVGDSMGPDDNNHAVFWQSPTAAAIVLPALGGEGAGRTGTAFDINDAGQVIGTSDNASYQQRPTLWTNGVAMELVGLDQVVDINNLGQIVGTRFIDAVGNRPVVWANGVAEDLLGLNGDPALDVSAINNSGQILGTSLRANGETAVTLWDGDQLIDVSKLVEEAGGSLYSAEALNDHGWMVGRGIGGSGAAGTYVMLIPVPEPDAVALMLAGAAVLGLGWGRKKLRAAQTSA